jgi:hypothetical protein
MNSNESSPSTRLPEAEVRKRIQEKIKFSGKPFEMVISSYLDTFGWKYITNTDTFLDIDEKKLRDIDIVACDDPISIGNLELETYLAIECKAETKCAWVFYTRPNKFKTEDVNGHYLDEAQMAAESTENTEILDMIINDAQLHYKTSPRVAVAYERVPIYHEYDPERQEDENEKRSTIFEAITKAQNQLKKYVDWSIDIDIRKRTQLLPRTIEMYFPCIALRGPLYEAILEGDTSKLEPKLVPRENLVLKTLYRSTHSIYEKNILIDVVTENHFQEYQKQIQNDISSIKEAIAKNEEPINDRINDILSFLESARRNK